MPKLKAVTPRLGTLAPRIGYAPGNEQERSRHRDATQAWRAWYKNLTLAEASLAPLPETHAAPAFPKGGMC